RYVAWFGNSSVVIHDFYVEHIAFAPNKAEPPLIINSDAVLARTISAQQFETIPGRRAKELDGCCRMQKRELARCHRTDGPKPTHRLTAEQSFGVLAAEVPDHP
ncbi:MAG: hypothetical protein RL756_2760, partial [Pseudomonadota bacterium]